MREYYRWAYRAWPSRRPATVYMFHSIGNRDVGCHHHTPEVFEAFLKWLVRRARVVPLADLSERVRHGRSRSAVAALTFDDGFLDNFTVAYPLLRKYDCPATFFIPTGCMDRPDMMAPDMLRELSANGMSIGSHSVSHPRLSRLASDQIEYELSASKKWLSDITGVECTEFCYPYGDFNENVKDFVRKTGYNCAVAVSQRTQLRDPFEIPRVVIPRIVSPWRFATTLFAPGAWSLVRPLDPHAYRD